MKTTRISKRAIFMAFVIFISIAMIFGFSISRAQEEVVTVPAVECQYPSRSTNPPGGCDNSDPCDPADAAKGGSGQCADAPAVVPQSTSQQTTVKQETNQCLK